MPHNWEFVIAAYGIWAVALLAYALRLYWKGRAINRALSRLNSARER